MNNNNNINNNNSTNNKRKCSYIDRFERLSNNNLNKKQRYTELTLFNRSVPIYFLDFIKDNKLFDSDTFYY